MNEREAFGRLEIFAAGAAHLDRRGRCSAPYRAGASNPGTMRESVGGAAFNACRAARISGASVRLVSGRGGDPTGAIVQKALLDAGIDDMAMTWLDRTSPTYTAILDGNGNLVGGLADMALYDMMQPRVFKRRHLREALARSHAVLIDANLPEATIARLASEAVAPVFAIGVSPAKAPRLRGALSALAAVFLSRAEAAAWTGVGEDAPLSQIADRLAAIGCRRAVITDGSRSAAILDGGQLLFQSPPCVAAVHDVTGAGDTLAGIATVGFACGMVFADAARLGMAAASRHIATVRSSSEFTWDGLRAIAAQMPPAATTDAEIEPDRP